MSPTSQRSTARRVVAVQAAQSNQSTTPLRVRRRGEVRGTLTRNSATLSPLGSVRISAVRITLPQRMTTLLPAGPVLVSFVVSSVEAIS